MLTIHEDILSMLIRLAYNHNRYYIGQKLAQYIVNLDNNRLNELIIVCEILQENENYAKWLKNYLLHYELPYIVQEAI